MAPALNLAPELRRKICDAAVALGRAIGYDNAGTVEFLLDQDTDQFYFIEINPRIQVEHTVTEEVTGVDLVHHQILIAEGLALDHPEIGLASQSDVQVRGHACQCRVTTEDPENSFIPDYGRILHYRSASGAGIRLDAGTAFSGATVTPFYDSLLVKVTAWGLRFPETVRRMERCLQEFSNPRREDEHPFPDQSGGPSRVSEWPLHDSFHRRESGPLPFPGPPGPGDPPASLSGESSGE